MHESTENKKKHTSTSHAALSRGTWLLSCFMFKILSVYLNDKSERLPLYSPLRIPNPPSLRSKHRPESVPLPAWSCPVTVHA